MCLILFSVQSTPEYPLIVAANRDEQHSRATQRAAYWQDAPGILAGRDLVAGGTWLGVNHTGRFAAVTNFAEAPPDPMPTLSRGALTADFLNSHQDCRSYLEQVKKQGSQFRGFNLLISDGQEVWYFSNRSNQTDTSIKKLSAGYYGLSNQLLDCDWPKVEAGRTQLQELSRKHVQQNLNDLADTNLRKTQQPRTEHLEDALFDMLSDKGDDRNHSAKFILGETYGTSVSTVVIQHNDHIRFEERAFNPEGSQINRVTESFAIDA